MEIAFRKTIGCRKRQEDSNFQGEAGKYKFFVVSDGMGGLSAGDVVSNCIVNVFEEAFKTFPENCDICNFLQSTLSKANTEVEKLASGGGATIIACIIKDNFLNWISVGDSPLLLFRNNKFFRLNQNHSKVISQDAFAHTNILTSCVMGEKIPMIDCECKPFKLQENDFLFISTDGILDIENVSPNFLQKILSDDKIALDEKLKSIFEILSTYKYTDNTTTYLLKF